MWIGAWVRSGHPGLAARVGRTAGDSPGFSGDSYGFLWFLGIPGIFSQCWSIDSSEASGHSANQWILSDGYIVFFSGTGDIN